jgi:single-strand DNA-binding protein
MPSLNKVQLIGALGRDPEVKYLASGTTVANFSLATSERKSNSEEKRTEWHNIVAYGRLAEVCGEYLKKGSMAYVEGSLMTRKWEKDGHNFSKTEIVINNIQFLSRKESEPPEQRQPGDEEDVPF